MEKNLQKIIKDGENEKTEFKENFCDEAIEALTAMANSVGGKVFLGVNNRKKITGVAIGKESIQKWLNEIKHKTDFKIIPDVAEVKNRNKKIVVFSIPEYPSKPISFRGRYYKRINTGNHLMTIEEIANEYLRVRNRSWDMFADEEASLSDLDFDKINKLIEKINQGRDLKIADDPLSFLRKFDLIFSDKITNAAMLLFSKKPLFFTEIQIGLFETDTTIKKSLTIKTDLFSEADLVMDFIMAHITKEYIITGKPQRDERWQYPLSAIREFVINAIIHRDYRSGVHSQFRVYRNKMVFWNIGKLPKDLTIEDLYSGEEKSTPRNLKVAEIFKEAGLIEKYGSGIKRAVDEILSYNLPKPKIKEISGGINVNIFAEDKDTVKDTAKDTVKDTVRLSKKEDLIIDFIRKNPIVTAEWLSEKLKINLRNTKKNIAKLKEAGIIKRIGPDKGGYWKVSTNKL